MGEARHRLGGSGDNALTALDSVLGDVLAQLDDVAGELTGYLDRLDADPERLARVLGRQAELKALTRKYAADADGVLAWAEQARERLEHLDTSDDALAALAARRDALAGELAGHAAAVTAARTAAAARLAEGTTAELGGLAMPDARLLVAVTPRTATPGAADALRVGDTLLAAGVDGVDEVELRLVAHPGATPQPLHKGASGGELSRVMLALEVALAGADPVPTMVFDEVDAGVGGRAAVEIGRRLARLAARHQVVVVTHLPQVAAYADRHLLVDKARAGDGPARSRVRTLDEDERVGELARMLAGLDETDTGRAHAEELLAAARAHRETDRRSTGATESSRPGRRPARSGARPGLMHVVACTDSRGIGGAEISLANLVAEVDPGVRVDVLGVDDAVVARVAAGRSGTRAIVAPAAPHPAVLARLRPDVVHANLAVPWSSPFDLAGALALPRAPGRRRAAAPVADGRAAGLAAHPRPPAPPRRPRRRGRGELPSHRGLLRARPRLRRLRSPTACRTSRCRPARRGRPAHRWSSAASGGSTP